MSFFGFPLAVAQAQRSFVTVCTLKTAAVFVVFAVMHLEVLCTSGVS